MMAWMPVSIWINICPNAKIIQHPEHELQNRKSEFFLDLWK
jgi:hypothetical protein